MDMTVLLPRWSAAVTLRTLQHRDARGYSTGSRDAQVRRFAHLPEPDYSPARVSELIETTIEAGLRSGTLGVLAIAERETDGFLGSLVLFDVTADSAEVGFWLAPWGRSRGAATCALRLGQQLGRDLGLASLQARTVASNGASRRVLERAGFRPSGCPEPGAVPSGGSAVLQHYTAALGEGPPPGGGRVSSPPLEQRPAGGCPDRSHRPSMEP